jgi:predicted transcriptional regulator
MACILEHSNVGARKTRLIYRCNLSVAQFNKYVEGLIEGGLLEKRRENGVQLFVTTEKGREFLQDYERIKETLDQMRLRK